MWGGSNFSFSFVDPKKEKSKYFKRNRSMKSFISLKNYLFRSYISYLTYTSEFEFYYVPHLYGLEPHLSKKPSKLQNVL